jgi:hypothetical protein
MKTITGEGFKLPFVGKDTFLDLMKTGIGYNKENQTFFLKNVENIGEVRELLRGILREDVTFAQRCFICKVSFPCTSCSHEMSCSTSDIPLYCICNSCRKRTDLYDLYVEKERKILL